MSNGLDRGKVLEEPISWPRKDANRNHGTHETVC
jgi:hypothetical protein